MGASGRGPPIPPTYGGRGATAGLPPYGGGGLAPLIGGGGLGPPGGIGALGPAGGPRSAPAGGGFLIYPYGLVGILEFIAEFAEPSLSSLNPRLGLNF